MPTYKVYFGEPMEWSPGYYNVHGNNKDDYGNPPPLTDEEWAARELHRGAVEGVTRLGSAPYNWGTFSGTTFSPKMRDRTTKAVTNISTFKLPDVEYPVSVKLTKRTDQSMDCQFENQYDNVVVKGKVYLCDSNDPDNSASTVQLNNPEEFTLQPKFGTGYNNTWTGTHSVMNENKAKALAGKRLAIKLVQTAGTPSGFIYVQRAEMEITTGYIYTPCDNPHEMSVPAFGAPNVLMIIQWGPGGPGVDNYVTGYQIDCRYSLGETPHFDVNGIPDDDSEWGSWSTISSGISPDSRLIRINPNPNRGRYTQFRVRTMGSAGVDFASAFYTVRPCRTNTLPNEPSGLSASPSLWESGSVSLSWTAAEEVGQDSQGKDLNAGISAYQIGYLIEGSSGVVSVAAVDKTVTSFNAGMPSVSRGQRVKFAVRTVDNIDENSEWIYSGWVVRNSIPSPLTGLSASPAVYESTVTNGITVSWNASTDVDGNLAGYRVEYSVSQNNSSWGEWTVYANSGRQDGLWTLRSCVHQPNETVLPRASYIRYQVTPVDALGAEGIPAVSNSVYRNRLPLSPSFLLPVVPSGSSGAELQTYTPAVKLAYSADPDGHTQWACIRVMKGNEQICTAQKQVSYGAGTVSIRFTVPANKIASSGTTFTVYAWMDDGYGVSAAEASVNIKLTKPVWNREISSGTIISDQRQNISHQADITEMVAKANAKRAAYGLDPFNSIVVNGVPMLIDDDENPDDQANGWFVYWRTIMATIVSQMVECYRAVDENPAAPAITSQYPSAAAVNAVRNLISGA